MANYTTYSTLDSLLLDELCTKMLATHSGDAVRALTVNLRNSVCQNLLLDLLVLQTLEHVGNDRLGELGLLVLLLLLLEPHPAVKDSLHLSRKRNLLLLNERLRFQLCSLLRWGRGL